MSTEAKSELLSPEEVATITTPEEETTQEQPEVELPSETPDFEMPEKFKDKSPEEIAKAYVELEKMKQAKQEEPLVDSPKAEQTKVTEEEFQSYFNEYVQNQGLSEESYNKLQEKGFTKEQVNEQIEFIQYKQEKIVTDILKPYGGIDNFKEASDWARENWTQEQVDNTNKQLASGNKEVIDAVLTGLFSAYNTSKRAVPDITLHTNQKPVQEAKRYETKSDYLKDANDPRYDKDAAFRRKVEEKMANTDLSSWY